MTDYSQTAANNAEVIQYLRNEKGIDSGLLAQLSSEGKIEHLYGNSKPLVLKGDVDQMKNGQTSNVVLVFDKNIDLLSFATLSKDKSTLESVFGEDHKIALRASQDTPFFEPLKKFLEDNPDTDVIIPCFAEKVGFDGVMNTLKDEFGNDYKIGSNMSPRGGSWNKALMEHHEANQLTDEQEEGLDMEYDDD